MITTTNNKITVFQIVLFVLAIYAVVILTLQATVHLSSETQKLLNIFDNLICCLFLADFGIRLKRAESKSEFFFKKWGWIDLLASIPALDQFRALQGVRIFRIK